MKLTAKGIRGAELPPGKTDQLFWDDDIPGFGLRLRAGGSRNWIFQYALGKKQRRMSLGAATPESFTTIKDKDGKDAIKLGIRDQVALLHAKVMLGQDPASDKTESRKRASDTFETIAKQFLIAKKTGMRPGSYDQIRRHIETYAQPLNGLQVAKIVRRDVATLIGAVKENSGAVTSNRVRSTLSDFFSWAISEGIDGIESNPVIGTNKSEEVSRERVLDDHELRAIWKQAGDDHYGSIVKLLMLTGQRADEIASLRWSEITETTVPEKRVTDAIRVPQFNTKAIDLPGERTKNGRPHIVPLSEPAQAIIAKQPQRATSDGSLREFVFGIGQLGFSGWSRCKERLDRRVLKELREVAEKQNDLKLLARLLKVEDLMARIAKAKGADRKALRKQLDAIWWKHHDLRRSMDTIMNDHLDVLPHVVEAIVNHVSTQKSGKSGVSGVYNKALYLRERTEALARWADHLLAVVEGRQDNVIPLKQAAE